MTRYALVAILLLGLGQIDLTPEKDTRTLPASPTEYPSLYKHPGVIVIFSIDGCVACVRQKQLIDSDNYNVLFINMRKPDRPGGLLWEELRKAWGLPNWFPVTVIVENGKQKSRFIGLTPWGKIRETADLAKKVRATNNQPQ